jgi:hypothetical protein
MDIRVSFSFIPASVEDIAETASDRVLGALLLRRDMGVEVPLPLLLSGGPLPLGVRDWPSGLGEELSWARGGAAMTLLVRTADEEDEDEDAGSSLRGLPPRKT